MQRIEESKMRASCIVSVVSFFEKGILKRPAATNMPAIEPKPKMSKYIILLKLLWISAITNKTMAPLPARPCISPTP